MIQKYFVLAVAVAGCSGSLSAQTYQELVKRSVQYLDNRDYAAAEQSLKAAMEKEPANPDNYLLMFNLGVIRQTLGKYGEALTSYNIALGKYPDNLSILHCRASLYCDTDSLDNALEDYNAILRLDSCNIEALYRRALIYMDKKNDAAAEADFDRMMSIDPSGLRTQTGRALLLKRKGEWEKAEAVYTDLIYEHRDNPDLYLNRAECYLEQEKLARTQDDLNRTAALGCGQPLLYILRGQLKLRQFDKPAARNDFIMAREAGADPVLVEELLRMCR